MSDDGMAEEMADDENKKKPVKPKIILSSSKKSATEVFDYWTKKKFEEAKPVPMPTEAKKPSGKTTPSRGKKPKNNDES